MLLRGAEAPRMNTNQPRRRTSSKMDKELSFVSGFLLSIIISLAAAIALSRIVEDNSWWLVENNVYINGWQCSSNSLQRVFSLFVIYQVAILLILGVVDYLLIRLAGKHVDPKATHRGIFFGTILSIILITVWRLGVFCDPF